MTLFLSEHPGDARPDTLLHLRVSDVHALGAAVGVIPQDNPWGWEIEASDPDGNRPRIGTPSWW